MRNLYKKLSFVMVMGISLSSYAAWNGDATAWTQGDGSEQNPFLIENEAQLSHLQQTVTAGETYQGKFFRLTADLDMAGKQMPSIGNYNDYTTQENPELVRESKVFRGTFDGDFHTIDNLTIVNNNADPTLGGVGLFAISYPETYICNLILGKNVTIEGSDFDCVAGFVGYGSGGKVENCRFMGLVNGGSMNAGGIVGAAEVAMTISGCVNTGRLVVLLGLSVYRKFKTVILRLQFRAHRPIGWLVLLVGPSNPQSTTVMLSVPSRRKSVRLSCPVKAPFVQNWKNLRLPIVTMSKRSPAVSL